MAKPTKKTEANVVVETIRHYDEKRRNIPSAEHQALVETEHKKPVEVRYPRNTDLDPQLVWRGKDEQDWSDLVVHAPPLYIQEKVHPKVLVDDLIRTSKERSAAEPQESLDLFGDFNGLPSEDAKTEFYQHDQNWSNRMILGDSLQVMASLAEREGLRGRVQCIYFDPPYGIKFNSNFQWSTTSRDVKDGKADHITREPEQVKAFRDTWRDGIHSYLTYLRDRLTVARDLLTDSGSIFVQIGDENVHRVRALMDGVFGDANCVSLIHFVKTTGKGGETVDTITDEILWYCRNRDQLKVRSLWAERARTTQIKMFTMAQRPDLSVYTIPKKQLESGALPDADRCFKPQGMFNDSGGQTTRYEYSFEGRTLMPPGAYYWRTNIDGMRRVERSGRLILIGNTLSRKQFEDDFPVTRVTALWLDTMPSGFASESSIYVVQTSTKVIQRCILMVSDPGDLVLDPTCGSGTTATVAEQWGRRWITIDTSRVALALARARIMGARYPYYLLADSKEGQLKEAEVTQTAPSTQATHGNIRHGFVYERVPHITLKSIANNAEIDVIWDKWQRTLEPLREKLNAALFPSSGGVPEGRGGRPSGPWQEWQIPREADPNWPDAAKKHHADWWLARIARQKEIDASIAAKAEFEYLYDKPYEDKKKVRVAGPFTVESISPYRMLGVNEDDELMDPGHPDKASVSERDGFVAMILENLRAAGLQQAAKSDRIQLDALHPWPGRTLCAEARFEEAGVWRRAGVYIGPEFGTVSRPDLVDAVREAAEAGFDVLISCAFNYDAHSSDFDKLGRIPILKARMNADLHMADDLKSTGKGNLFVIFGEPDIQLRREGDQCVVEIHGVDVFDPSTGEIRSDDADGIACWFVDTDYNGESFFVRQAYFLGANDPYKALKTTLKSEIDADAWATLNSATSRPFPVPSTGRIAVKVINHLGDEAMKVMKV